MYIVSKTIEMDCGHRVIDSSKCSSLHGHRYKVEAFCEAKELQKTGQERGMVVDFGILKQAMTASIHDAFDHRLILDKSDPLLTVFKFISDLTRLNQSPFIDKYATSRRKSKDGCDFFQASAGVYYPHIICVTPEPPTAEHLAKLWFIRLQEALDEALDGASTPIESLDESALTLVKVKVWETPNSVATYRPQKEDIDNV